MTRIGCHLERFLAPVEPGNLFLLGYKDDVPIVSAPGCFRSAKPNMVDLVLPPMLARYRFQPGKWRVWGMAGSWVEAAKHNLRLRFLPSAR